MAGRIVDRELWRSKKLRDVPVDMRSEFANLLPLAEANGAFEYDPSRVWSDVYSYNRQDISEARCEEILEAYINAGMLELHEQNGKTYAFFAGIDKPGRLPSPKHQERYANLPPVPTRTYQVPDPEPTPVSTGNRPIESEIESRCRAALNQCEEKIHWRKELRAAVQTHGYDVVLQAFDLWAESQTVFTGRRPVSTFLRAMPSFVGVSRSPATVKSAALQQVEDAIALISNNVVVFSNMEKPHLALMLKEHGPESVIQVFREFYAKLDDYGQKWATKNFLEKSPQFLRTLRIQREEREKQETFAASQAAAMQEQAQAEAADLATREAEETVNANAAFAEFE